MAGEEVTFLIIIISFFFLLKDAVIERVNNAALV